MHQVTTSPEPIRAVSVAEAADIIPNAERILVFGCSGTGKSTLAQALARRFGLTYVSMDRDIFWLPGWKLRPREDSVQRIRDAVAGERWIMDGNSPGTLPIRLPRTDIVLWRRPPRSVAVSSVLRRWWKYRGQTRPEMAPGCPEKIDLKFLHYIWTFEKREAPQFEAMLASHGCDVPVLTLRSFQESNELLSRLPAANG
jgi:adenylate kinase family enzyme